MITLTKQQATEVLAEMRGWKKKYVNDGNEPRGRYWCRGCAPMCLVKDFQPLEDANQAIECLEAWRKQVKSRRVHLCTFSAYGDGDPYSNCELFEEVEEVVPHGYDEHPDLKHAICTALVSAYKGETVEVE